MGHIHPLPLISLLMLLKVLLKVSVSAGGGLEGLKTVFVKLGEKKSDAGMSASGAQLSF